MPLRLSAFLELLVVLLAAASQSYAQTYPKSPLQPTMQDCNALFHAYFYNIITPLNERIDQCMSTPARIDYVNRCDGGGRFLEAWPQCHQLHCQWNEAERQRSEQMRICQARALANQDRQRKLDQENEALRKIRDSVDTYDKLKNTYDQATSFVRDPFGYLQKALGQKIYDSIFPKDSPRPQLVGKAEDIFRFTFAAARKGLKEANKYRSPVIGAIQEEALRRVEDQLKSDLTTLDYVASEFKRFGADTDQGHNPPVATRPASRSSGDCAILRDAAQSRALQDRDENAWLDLMSRCTAN